MWFNEFIYKQHGGGRLSNLNEIITIKKSKKQKATITETLFGIKKNIQDQIMWSIIDTKLNIETGRWKRNIVKSNMSTG